MRGVLVMAFFLLAPPLAAAELPPGPFDEAACRDCHRQQTPDLVTDWRDGRHGPEQAGCAACHGQLHGALAAARQGQACVDCHGGPKASLVHAYTVSKHGVIAGLEAAEADFTLPLAEGNQRAPSCAYCHLHEADHGASAETAEAACLDCHSPRFVDTLLASARRGLAIGQLKFREAEAAAAAAAAAGIDLGAELKAMREGPLAALRQGLAHHSPDHQWWLGQAALDGALLRIKAAITRHRRRRALGDQR
ncbi:MAG TPA: multiheme c-type cytochrome [Alphaproteobacteria bacterium]|jgi:hypothetical protein|nr:multiheme c-type cytochrome [Alphaproteobacteria bacterium]MDP6269070.1 multiheme c-type cytochrome [Alphaproteobacteria bacterium]MDP7164843.1 multiheme c-type cytochrome [Alphaproteobacteria bacterium]MDP7427550.1 multiheme c-type cytochrome [Alphaproteobacteria bacterium]HJM51924.1 multiheme c-type cytochrome [Alphaproteobacteria bacterium]